MRNATLSQDATRAITMNHIVSAAGALPYLNTALSCSSLEVSVVPSGIIVVSTATKKWSCSLVPETMSQLNFVH